MTLVHDKSDPPRSINRTPQPTVILVKSDPLDSINRPPPKPVRFAFKFLTYKFLLVVGLRPSVENSADCAKPTAAGGLRPGHPCGVPPDKPAPPPAKWLAFGQDALPGRGQGRAVQLDRLRRAGRYAPRQEPAAQAERPQWAFRKGASRADVPQNGHQSAQEGRRSVFQGRGGPNPAKPSKSAYGASWGVRWACHTLNLS